MGSFAEPVRNALLDAVVRGIPYSNAQIWLQLHIGDPLSDGTGSPAVNATRKLAAFVTAAAIGAVTNTSAVSWTNAPATETYTHLSAWSAATAGTFLGSVEIPSPVETPTNDTITIPAGALVFEL